VLVFCNSPAEHEALSVAQSSVVEARRTISGGNRNAGDLDRMAGIERAHLRIDLSD